MNALSQRPMRDIARIDEQPESDDDRSRGREQAYVLRDDTLSEQAERLYDREIDGMIRRRRSVRGRRRPDRRTVREWRDIGVRMHRPRESDV
ncbi:hypothetical protein [Nocardia alni]|uniref:hypothetical protein n=1 Tax=Nocardia alni TaxID=2815723 RepID=UPI001C2310B3|nr:hypothetical protein [Nocardia alni]